MTQATNPISLFIATLFVGLSAHAFVHPDGTFIPNQCGQQTIAVADAKVPTIVSACLGSIAGNSDHAVQFRLADDSNHTFVIADRQDLLLALLSHNTMAIFRLVGADGEAASMKAILDHDGHFKSFSGEFQTTSFLVPSLQVMMTPM